MNNYLLLDGALIHDDLQSVGGFKSPRPWYATLLPGDARLAGPVLLGLQQLTDSNPDTPAILRSWVKAYPGALHASFIDSPLQLQALAGHLGQHLRIATSDGLPLALRLADCRVLAILPKVLTPDQWQQLTAPLARWQIHGRDGKPLDLPVAPAIGPASTGDTRLLLSDPQIEHLTDLAEPDALLAAVGRTPLDVSPDDLPWAHDVARYSLRLWREAGHTDRDVLHTLARRAFATRAKVFDQPDALQQILGTA